MSGLHHFQKNLHIFKQTFQKPSQIYKYLADFWKKNPLYLTRTLSYVSKHRNRPVKNRHTSIDTIASELSKKHSRQNIRKTPSNNQLDKNCDTSKSVDTPEDRSNMKPVCLYNWICNDSVTTNQKTKSYGFICAWCDSNLHHLDSLIMHLKCCHFRFNFNIVEEGGLSVIEMTLNSSFDGSYCGFKYPGHNLKRDFKFTPSCPERRTPTTQVIFFKAKRKRTRNNLTTKSKSNNYEVFNYDDGDVDVDVCSGRLYYHTSTCLPIKPFEVDLDSEADMDPDWLRERTQLMIDEFTDVNEGEKEILKLWNLHIMKNYKYKGDNMIPQACLDFVESEGQKILSSNLYKNFTLHLVNLYDFGLLSSGDILECVRKLKKFNTSSQNISPTKTVGKTRSERNSNEHCQHSPAKRALLYSQCN